MTAVPTHVSWLVDTGQRLKTACGQDVIVLKLDHTADAGILSSWAAHLRKHYCLDEMLPALVDGTGYTNQEYLLNIKFPDASDPPGPSIRSGDFAEIIVADYIEFVLNFWCPREIRYSNKISRNESSKGCDVIGFKFASDSSFDQDDELFIFEAKAKLTGKPGDRLQDAINDSIKDAVREGMSLNAIKQKFIELERFDESRRVQRFQNYVDRPFRRLNGAAAIYSTEAYDETLIQKSTAVAHQNKPNLVLLVVHGDLLMDLVHALYETAANEA